MVGAGRGQDEHGHLSLSASRRSDAEPVVLAVEADERLGVVRVSAYDRPAGGPRLDRGNRSTGGIQPAIQWPPIADRRQLRRLADGGLARGIEVKNQSVFDGRFSSGRGDGEGAESQSDAEESRGSEVIGIHRILNAQECGTWAKGQARFSAPAQARGYSGAFGVRRAAALWIPGRRRP